MTTQNTWITISITPPKLGVMVVARTANFLDYGRTCEAYQFDSDLYDEESAASFLQGRGFIEWLELPE